ncbi:uncharacterized protein [Arachis hypogaea]|uniref:uncharacterized protein n=1 Tax=Arachis hypogaea TaxID=3818 RepID=UPI000DEC7D22|nr:uncharacterized protein LOC112794859 [Arachis hypogaea]
MTRFAKATVEIPDLDPNVHLHALKSGLRPEKFQETIAVTKPKTLEEFREKAAWQMEIEELTEARRTEKPQARREEEKHSRATNQRDNRKPFKLTPKYDAYTQFNTKTEDIIKEILNAIIIKPPSQAGAYQDQRYIDKLKHCAFHQKFGHTTAECVIPKDLLERLARQGHIDKYIGNRMKPTRQNTNDPQIAKGLNEKAKHQPPPTRGVINCISGGFARGGNTSSARKCNYRTMMMVQTTQASTPQLPSPCITFEQADYQAPTSNQDDPVVISIQAGDLLIRKVLFDPSSSADVLFYSTFIKMKLSTNMMQPYVGELVNFSGECVSVLGSIWLKITLGQHPLCHTRDMQFLVVECPSPYNMIMDRPSLNSFYAIVSTVHLCVKFQVSSDATATIHSDQT